ncbi:MAG: ABC transporter ATP-binding protein [Candidatus Omnitrophota bacterium]
MSPQKKMFSIVKNNYNVVFGIILLEAPIAASVPFFLFKNSIFEYSGLALLTIVAFAFERKRRRFKKSVSDDPPLGDYEKETLSLKIVPEMLEPEKANNLALVTQRVGNLKGEHPVLKLENLFKKFGDKHVLSGINLSLNRGEICCFIGENGAGKTTTIKIIMDLLKPDAGEILFWGEKASKKILKKIAYVSDTSILYEKFKVKHYLNFIGEIYGKKEESELRMNYYAETLNIKKYFNDFICNLSLGTKKKVMILASLLYDPEIVLMDEPFANLDPLSQYNLKQILLKLREEGKTFLISSHSMDLVEEISDRIFVMKKGEIQPFKYNGGSLLNEYISYLQEVEPQTNQHQYAQ